MDGPSALEQRLERGEIVVFDPCPFTLPTGSDRELLFSQQLSSFHKNITLDPSTGELTGVAPQGVSTEGDVKHVLAEFSRQAIAWIESILPDYVGACEPDRVTFRPEEEATRRLRRTARNDLLHLDAFPSRPSQGRRILRLFVNLNTADPRVWATSETFPILFGKYGRHVGMPSAPAPTWRDRLVGLFQPGAEDRTPYDRFMLRLHHFLKTSNTFQERAPRRLQYFLPGSAWLVFTDMLCHAELRGRFALEHSFFVAEEAMTLPDLSPPALFSRACGAASCVDPADAGHFRSQSG